MRASSKDTCLQLDCVHRPLGKAAYLGGVEEAPIVLYALAAERRAVPQAAEVAPVRMDARPESSGVCTILPNFNLSEAAMLKDRPISGSTWPRVEPA